MKYFLIFVFLISIFNNRAYSQCIECENEKKDLQRKLDEKERQYNKLISKQSNDKNLRNQIDSLRDSINTLSSKNDSLNKEFDNFLSAYNDCQSKLKNNQKQLEVRNDSLNQYKAKRFLLQNTIDSLHIELKECEEVPVGERLTKREEKLKNEIASKEKEKNSITQHISKLGDEKKQINNEIEELNTTKEKLSRDIKDLDYQQTLNNTKLKELLSTISSKEYEKDKLNDIINDNQKTISNLEKEIIDQNSTLYTLRNNIAAANKELALLRSQIPGYLKMGIAISFDWNYGVMREKYTVLDINAFHSRIFLGYNLDRPFEDDYSTAVGIFMSYGAITSNSMKSVLKEQNIEISQLNTEYINQFYEIEGGLIVSEVIHFSLGYGKQSYEIIERNTNVTKELSYFLWTIGIQAPIDSNFDVGISTTMQYGQQFDYINARIGLYASLKFDFFKMK